MQVSPRPDYRELASPLAIAGYAAIAAVWLSAVPSLAAQDPALARGARIALLAFAAGYVGMFLPGGALRERACLVLLAAATFGLLWLGPTGSSGILLVILVAVCASVVPVRRLALLMVAANLALLAIMRTRWGASWGGSLGMLAAWGSFQFFAALLMHYTARAEAMAEALRASNAELLATRSLLVESARDAERVHIARELHDVAGHKLTALKLNLAAGTRGHAARGDATRGDPSCRDAHAELHGIDDDRLRLCAQLADELLADIRGVVARMRRDEGLDLASALQALAAPFPRPRMHLDIGADARAPSLAHAEAVLRAVQEALTNSARHSQARNLWVVLRRDGAQLQLDIRDDGRDVRELRPGNGLSGMRERLEALGGGLGLERTPTGGVRLLAWLPAA